MFAARCVASFCAQYRQQLRQGVFQGADMQSIAKLEAMQMQFSNGRIFGTSGAPTFLRGVLMVISRRLYIVELVSVFFGTERSHDIVNYIETL